MGVYLPYTRLPSEYQEVEYIESSGGQYINTGYLPNSSAKIDIDFMFLGGNSNTRVPIYGRRGTNTDNIGLYVQTSSLYVSPNYAGFDPGTSSGLTISKNVKYNILQDKGQFYIDGVYKSSCSTTNTLTEVNYPVWLFENNIQGSGQGRNTQMRLYGCKMYNGTSLLRNFIPCYRKSDSVIGLYDLVNSAFYTNSGTGTFSKGNDVTMSELKNAYIGEYVQNFATQGPAPDGFHVPLTTEWQAVYNVWTALGGGSSDGTNFGIALKLPFAGLRGYSSADVDRQGTIGRYWSSSRGNANGAYSLYLTSTNLYPQSYINRAYGFPVRCFKNSPTIPTSSWTKLYGTSIESGGIFWSSTDGLISLSSNGTTWITIMDKNLGATTVWNSGDTLSESNCGKYYQRGNNYGFPRTGSVTTSPTQVDASTYGPGNYYSSSTFITRSSSPYRWDTTDNANLWGGEDGNVPVD